MKIAFNVIDFNKEQHWNVPDENIAAMMLRPGFVEVGLHRSEVSRPNEIAGCPQKDESHAGSYARVENERSIAQCAAAP